MTEQAKIIEACARIADAEYDEKVKTAGLHKKEGRIDSMDRCFSAARCAARIAEAIRALPKEGPL